MISNNLNRKVAKNAKILKNNNFYLLFFAYFASLRCYSLSALSQKIE